jgi:hypothetical protein
LVIISDDDDDDDDNDKIMGSEAKRISKTISKPSNKHNKLVYSVKPLLYFSVCHPGVL